jgi:hypothetical protein
MNIGELKELIKDLPDEMEVCSCCASPINDPSRAWVSEEDYYDEETDSFVDITIVRIH